MLRSEKIGPIAIGRLDPRLGGERDVGEQVTWAADTERRFRTTTRRREARTAVVAVEQSGRRSLGSAVEVADVVASRRVGRRVLAEPIEDHWMIREHGLCVLVRAALLPPTGCSRRHHRRHHTSRRPRPPPAAPAAPPPASDEAEEPRNCPTVHLTRPQPLAAGRRHLTARLRVEVLSLPVASAKIATNATAAAPATANSQIGSTAFCTSVPAGLCSPSAAVLAVTLNG